MDYAGGPNVTTRVFYKEKKQESQRKYDDGSRSQSQRERLEDAVLLASRMEEGDL